MKACVRALKPRLGARQQPRTQWIVDSQTISGKRTDVRRQQRQSPTLNVDDAWKDDGGGRVDAAVDPSAQATIGEGGPTVRGVEAVKA